MSIDALIARTDARFNPADPVMMSNGDSPLPAEPPADIPIPRREFHRYGPADRPDPQPPVMPPSAIRTGRHEPLALCQKCKTYRPMKWKPPGERGKDVKTWFVCAVCGCDKLELRILPYHEAVRQNQAVNDDEVVPF